MDRRKLARLVRELGAQCQRPGVWAAKGYTLRQHRKSMRHSEGSTATYTCWSIHSLNPTNPDAAHGTRINAYPSSLLEALEWVAASRKAA